jgi:hypothetical protein
MRADLGDRRAGYGVTLQQGVSALKELGLLETALSHDVPSSSHYIFDPKGNIVGFFGRSFASSSEAGSKGASTKSKYNVHVRFTNKHKYKHTHTYTFFPALQTRGKNAHHFHAQGQARAQVHAQTSRRQRIVLAAHGAITSMRARC